jgi:hypothetical protein
MQSTHHVVGAAPVFSCYHQHVPLLLGSAHHLLLLQQDKSDINKQALLSDQLTSAQEQQQQGQQHTDSTPGATDPLQEIKPAVAASADASTADHTQQTATSPRGTAAVGAVVAACAGAAGRGNAFGTLMAAAQSSRPGSAGSSSDKFSAEEMQQQADRYGANKRTEVSWTGQTALYACWLLAMLACLRPCTAQPPPCPGLLQVLSSCVNHHKCLNDSL